MALSYEDKLRRLEKLKKLNLLLKMRAEPQKVGGFLEPTPAEPITTMARPISPEEKKVPWYEKPIQQLVEKEIPAAAGFVAFPYAVTKEYTYPMVKAMTRATIGTLTGKPALARGGLKEMEETAEKTREMSKEFASGVWDWIGLLSGDPADVRKAGGKIIGRIKVGGVVAESQYPLALAGVLRGMKGGIQRFLPEVERISPEIASTIRTGYRPGGVERPPLGKPSPEPTVTPPAPELLPAEKVVPKGKVFGKEAMEMAKAIREKIAGKPIEWDLKILDEIEPSIRGAKEAGGLTSIEHPFIPKYQRHRAQPEVFSFTTKESIYPPWWQGQGFESSTVLSAIDRAKVGKPLTPKQSEMLGDVVTSYQDFLKSEKYKEAGEKLITPSTITAGNLKVGDRVKVKGEWLDVTDVRPGEITIKDGQTFKLDEFGQLRVEGFEAAKEITKAPLKPLEQLEALKIERELPRGKISRETKLTPMEQLGELGVKPKPTEPSLFNRKAELRNRFTEIDNKLTDLYAQREGALITNRPKIDEQIRALGEQKKGILGEAGMTIEELHAGVSPRELKLAPEREIRELPAQKEGRIIIERSPKDMSYLNAKASTIYRAGQFSPETKEAFRVITKAENDARWNALKDGADIDNLAKGLPPETFNEQNIISKIRGRRPEIVETKAVEVINALEGRVKPETISEPSRKIYDFAKPFFEKYKEQIKEHLIERGVPEEEVANWGVADYFHRMLAGNVIVTAEPRKFVKGKWQYGKVLEVADNIWEGDKLARKISQTTEYTGKTLYVYSKNLLFPPIDVVRVSPSRYHTLVNQIADVGGWEVRDGRMAVRGVVGQRPGAKFGRMIMKRVSDKTGIDEIFVHDPLAVMRAYSWGVNRFLEMSKMRKQISPIYESLRKQGRLETAGWIEDLRKWTESPISGSEKSFQKTVESIPLLGDLVRPFILRRLVNKALKLQNVLKLTNPGYYFSQTSQSWVTQSPLDPGLWRKTALDIIKRNPEAIKVLTDAKHISIATPFTEGFGAARWGRIGKYITGAFIEDFNQPLSVVFGTRYGMKKLGLSYEQALEFGRMENIRVNFPQMASTTAPWMRGTARRIFTQYKPFAQGMIQNVMYEYGKTALKGDWKPASRFLARYFALTGVKGVTAGFRFAVGATALYQLYKSTKDEFGENVAKILLVGLPGLVDVDVSERIAVNLLFGSGDLYQKVGRTAMGPSVGDAIAVGTAIQTGDWEKVGQLSPWVRLIQTSYQEKPKGEIAISPYTGRGTYKVTPYQKTLKKVGIVPAEHTVQRLKEESIRTLDREWKDEKSEILQLYARGNNEQAKARKAEWNKKYPLLKIVITRDDIDEEKRKLGKTSEQRLMEQLGKRGEKLLKEIER